MNSSIYKYWNINDTALINRFWTTVTPQFWGETDNPVYRKPESLQSWGESDNPVYPNSKTSNAHNSKTREDESILKKIPYDSWKTEQNETKKILVYKIERG